MHAFAARKVAARPARTWIVSTREHPVRTDDVDHLARAAEGGLAYHTGDDLPPYLGVWIDPQNGHTWHLYSDYPDSHHERVGWHRSPADEEGAPRA